MKKTLYIIFTSIIILLLLGFLLYLNKVSIQNHNKIYCNKVEILIKDSSKYAFVGKNDILNLLRSNYGQIIGQKIDSINTKEIENILNNKNSIINCIAYSTNDGKLHIEIYQREPILRYNDGVQDYFIDETGYVFPAKMKYNAKIPLITGKFNIDNMVKNNNLSPKDKFWITNLIDMIKYINSNKYWTHFVKEITVDQNGNISIIPTIGKEVFFFGYPNNFKIKFKKIEDYYKYIVVEKGKDHYKFVNVKFQNQIICK